MEKPKQGSVTFKAIWYCLLLVTALFAPTWSGAQKDKASASPSGGKTGPLVRKGLLSPPAAPSFESITQTSWTRRDGAPGGIHALAQTKDGYLWIGSTWGLYRSDGLKFALFPFQWSNRRQSTRITMEMFEGRGKLQVPSARISHSEK